MWLHAYSELNDEDRLEPRHRRATLNRDIADAS